MGYISLRSSRHWCPEAEPRRATGADAAVAALLLGSRVQAVPREHWLWLLQKGTF